MGYGNRGYIWYKTNWFRRGKYVLFNFAVGVLFYFLLQVSPWILAVHFCLVVVQYIVGLKGIVTAAIEEPMLAIFMGLPLYMYFLN